MTEEGLTIFAHLSSGDTDRVAVRLAREGLWDGDGMAYDCDSTLLWTTTPEAKEVVMSVLEKLGLLPEGETTLRPTT